MADPRGVLVTRSALDAAETAARVAALGWEPVVAPLLTVQHKHIPADMIVEAVLVTSRNALPALLGYRDVRLLAVGAATAARATALGFEHVEHADGDGAALARLAGTTMPRRARVLLAHGKGQGGAVLEELRRFGMRARGRIAYAVEPATALPEGVAPALSAGRLHAAIFLSAETARTFVRLLPPELHAALATVEALVIGEPAAAALAPLPWRRVRVSLKPTLEHVLALL